MTQGWQGAAARLLATALACVIVAAGTLSDAGAQQQPPRSKATKKAAPAGGETKADLVTAQRYVETGITHLEAGRLDAAVASLTSALAASTLPAAQTARALHYRGVAYRRQGKPAQALSDLTSALSVRSGLTDAQRSEALKERAAAYRDAGLPDQSEADTIKAAKSTPPPSAPVTTAATKSSTAEPASTGGFFGSLFGGAATTSEPAPKPAPAAPIQTAAAWGVGTQVRAAPPSPEPRPPADPKKARAEPKAPTKPAGAPARPVKTKAVAAPAASGAVLVQVALVRNRAEAEKLAARIQTKHAKALAGRKATIDEVVLGNMGTLYRLRVGPYVTVADSASLCANLKSEGLHCMTSAQ